MRHECKCSGSSSSCPHTPLSTPTTIQDLSDRYVNNKTTKYLLRAGEVERAQATIALFARHEGDPQHNLFEMQCMWCVRAWAKGRGLVSICCRPF